ncbi:hypothetical protein N9391_01150 [Gammaproteobacteria bacterium]|nr:hypothetical protein [Gammaproteobacteria bacterium]
MTHSLRETLMIKTFRYLAVGIVGLLMLMVASQALASPVHTCQKYYNGLVKPVVYARELGVSHSDSLSALLEAGVPEDLSAEIINLVYFKGKNFKAGTLEVMFLAVCSSELS